MSINIHSIPLGLDRCYVIQDEGTIMIDGGFPGKAKAFKRAMERTSVKLGDIQLVVVTHGHFDHVGSARDIKEITGARVAMHRTDKERLEENALIWPPGVTTWGKISRALFRPVMSLLRFYMPPVDVLLGDEGLSLVEYGISGRVIHTPGHSAGSVSVLLDTGDAFVGCMAQNGLPFRLSPGLPIYAEDLEKVKQSWRLLLAQGARTVYPAHGEPFSVDIIREALF